MPRLPEDLRIKAEAHIQQLALRAPADARETRLRKGLSADTRPRMAIRLLTFAHVSPCIQGAPVIDR
jgi:hypothetical protein